SSISRLVDSLSFLSELLYQYYGNKVYILIDEYDAPIINSYKKEYFEEVVSLVRDILSEGLKDNIYLQTGILTGVFRIAKAQIFSGLNNIEEFSILDKQLAKYFGFLEEEVDKLFKYLDINLENRIEIQKKAKDW